MSILSCILFIIQNENEKIIVTQNNQKKYQEYNIRYTYGDNIEYDNQLDIFYDDKDYVSYLHDLRGYGCTLCDNNPYSLKTLKDHVSKVHKLFFCDLCLDKRCVFLKEQTLYTKDELYEHIRNGDKTEGFLGHPFCRYCKKNYYDENGIILYILQIF